MPSQTKEKKGRGWNVKGEEDNSQENGKRKYLLKNCLSHHAKSFLCKIYIYISSVQLLSCIQLFATPWTAAFQPSLSITNSQSLFKLMFIESAMPSNHLILCCSLLYIYINIYIYVCMYVYVYVYNSSFPGRLQSKLFQAVKGEIKNSS